MKCSVSQPPQPQIQLLISHMWLVAAILDRADTDISLKKVLLDSTGLKSGTQEDFCFTCLS